MDNLKKHKELMHAHIRKKFPCDSCEYSATTKGHLKTHKLVVHLGKDVKKIYLIYKLRFKM